MANLALEWENHVVQMVGQALLGLVSPEMRGVAVEIDGETVTVHFASTQLDGERQEDIDEVVAEVEGYLWPDTQDVRSRTFCGSSGPGWAGRQHRLVYLAKVA